MRRKSLFGMLAGAMALLTLFGAPEVATAGDAGTHVISITGRSTFVAPPCEYQWAKTSAGQPDRDAVGVPRPTQLPPLCKTDSAGVPIPCDLSRNLGPYPADPAHPNLVAGEVGLNPPCAGTLSANDLPGAQGCIEANGTQCNLSAPTWFYGYCGQTYGGASSGTLTLGGQPWTIKKMGFPRGRGAWEFNGKIANSTNTSEGFMRWYLTAVPNEPTQLAGCDVTHNISSIYFTGTLIITTFAIPVRGVSPQAGNPAGTHWNYCDNTPGTAEPLYNC